MFRNERKARKLVLIDTCCDLKPHSHNLTFYPTSSSKLSTAATSTTTCVTVLQQLMLLQFWGAHLYHSWCYAIGAQCFFEACVCVYVCVSVCFRPRPLSIRSSNRSLFSFSNVSPLPPYIFLSIWFRLKPPYRPRKFKFAFQTDVSFYKIDLEIVLKFKRFLFMCLEYEHFYLAHSNPRIKMRSFIVLTEVNVQGFLRI